MDISVILNVYKRPHTLEKQIEIVKKQSIPVRSENIHVWYNNTHNVVFPSDKEIKTYICNWNTKFHGRFLIPLLLKTEYVAILDDDTFPGNRWFENCIISIKKQDGLYGASGVILNGKTYANCAKVGWNGYRNPDIMEVDLVGHCWFARREIFKYLWYEEPYTFESGEDIALSYLIQKYGNIKTFVPPHGEDINYWGNTDNGIVGNDLNATWLNNRNHKNIRNDICIHYINNGWKTINNK